MIDGDPSVRETNMRACSWIVLLGCVAASLGPATPFGPASPRSLLAQEKRGDNLPRLPDDQVEGTVWEYKGTLKDKVPEGEEAPELSGYFRTEGKAIFDVGKRLPIPEKKDVDKAIDSFKKGKVKDFKLPPGPQQKRLGEYRHIQGNKLRLDFNDKESLNGLMVVWRKKNTEDVLIGTFQEKQGTKTIRHWDVELRPIED
jgi:hypothetical protein